MRRFAVSISICSAPFGFWPTEEAKWMNVQSPIAPVSVALRLSGQRYAYNHREANESGDQAGGDATRRPTGKTFSAKTSSANAATQTRFMTPKTNSSAINNAQQPRQ